MNNTAAIDSETNEDEKQRMCKLYGLKSNAVKPIRSIDDKMTHNCTSFIHALSGSVADTNASYGVNIFLSRPIFCRAKE